VDGTVGGVVVVIGVLVEVGDKGVNVGLLPPPNKRFRRLRRGVASFPSLLELVPAADDDPVVVDDGPSAADVRGDARLVTAVVDDDDDNDDGADDIDDVTEAA
jgi:hypothetical protein